MGHAQMLLAVAGLNDLEVEERVRVLASGDWSSFPSNERAALFFARKLARSPEQVGRSDIDRLVRHWGPELAIDLIWHTSWCNFMTRVADAFQMPLERENVFLAPAR